ncbi:hypothetical protein ZYGR_0AK01440 [Zygosaccharomyces rouxii]|uniref:Maintenance of telomere capping protein 1 n=1 Tax=Zygosaccharomyces rouxii TaxID=4956 RepID=A0A1Q3AD78_ZYGRO|nr:hypothetical protein ZYGR_0AK01440 [Zygosaccharomyces rouxii]
MTDKSKEDDVFEFLESLPEAKGAADSAGDKKKNEENKGSGKQGNEDIMDFLDELEKSNLSVPKKEEAQEKKKGEAAKMKPAKEEPAKEEMPKKEPSEEEKPVESRAGTPVESREETPLNDPITSLSNWWSSSGSATVSNFWSKTTEQASNIKTRLAQEQLDLTSRLNTNTITELARNLQKFVVGETEEVLRIHLVHDLVNFSFLQTIVDQKFDQVFSSQVQGGIRVFSDQWGHPHRTEDEVKSHFTSQQPKLNIFTGKITDGEKLAFANLENSIKLFQKAHEEFMKQKEAHSTAKDESREQEQETQDVDEEDKEDQEDRISDIFISILPIAIPTKQEDENEIVTTDPHQPGNFSFTVVLKDITNDISTITRSQSFPLKWVSWLEGDSEWKTKGKKEQEEKQQQQQQQEEEEEEEDEDVDPSDWVRDWVEDGLNVAFGVVAQNYVIKRMGF